MSPLIAHRCVLICVVLTAASRAVAQDVAVPSIQPTTANDRWRTRVVAAAEQAAAIGRDWLGVHPTGTITDITIDAPLWQGPAAMVVERQAATSVIRSWWPATLPDQRADAMLDGFAEYLQGHALESLFSRRYLRIAHSVELVPVFGSNVIWTVPTLHLSRWSMVGRPAQSHDIRSRYAAMFATLERWLGLPVLQGAMYEAARLPVHQLNAAALVETIDAASGQDLTWLFTAVADPSVTFDYAVASLSSAPSAPTCASPCFDTAVTVRRLGSGQFTGRSTARVGEFESGDAIVLRVTFANGDHAWARWDGRDDTRTFRFQGPSTAVAAHLDPDRVVVLDVNYLNNAIVPSASTNAPIRKWMARWMVWMQNTLLAYSFFA